MADIRQMANEIKDDRFISVGIGFIAIATIVCMVASSVIVACHDDCEPETTRCNGDRVEVCNSEGDWELAADCADIEDFELDIEWECCLDPYDGLYSCLPAEECDGELDGGN